MSEEFDSEGSPGEELPVVRGVVKWFNAEKGFGFIIPDDGTADIFLHHSVLREAGLSVIEGGATVVCAVDAGAKGRQASRVIARCMASKTCSITSPMVNAWKLVLVFANAGRKRS